MFSSLELLQVVSVCPSVMWEKGGLSTETHMGRSTGLSPALYQVFLGTLWLQLLFVPQPRQAEAIQSRPVPEECWFAELMRNLLLNWRCL